MMNLSLRDLTYFLEVAEHGNLAAAANAVHVTNPAVSKAVKRLEDELQLKLFVRTPRGMSLTAAGELLKAKASEMVGSYRTVMDYARSMQLGGVGLVRIGTSRPVLDSIIAPAIARVLATGAEVQFEIKVDVAGNLIPELLAAKLDVVLAPYDEAPPPELTVSDVGFDDLVVLARIGHPLAGERLALADVARASWLLPPTTAMSRRWLDQQFIRGGLPAPHVAIELDYLGAAAFTMTRETDMLLFGVRSWAAGTVPEGFQLLDLRDLSLARPLRMLTRDRGYWSVPMSMLLDQVRGGG